MAHKAAEWLAQLQRERQTRLALLLAPRLVKLPLVIQRYDDPFLPYGKAIINVTRDLVCAYVFDLAAYLTIGAAGAVALERTAAYISGEAMTIIHGPFTGSGYAALLDEGSFNVDAVTVLSQQDAAFYTARPDRTAFVVQDGQPPFEGKPHTGMYWKDAGLFTLPVREGVLTIQLAEESVLFAGMGEDFAQQTRAALEAIR